MSVKPWNDTMQHAIAEVEARILAVYPDATFCLSMSPEPAPGTHSAIDRAETGTSRPKAVHASALPNSWSPSLTMSTVAWSGVAHRR
jgi:hypothetical protein